MSLYIARAATGMASGPITLTVPSGTQNGDLMLAAISSSNTPTTPSGWTLIYSAVTVNAGGGTGTSGLWIYSRIASSEPASYLVTIAGGEAGTVLVHTYRPTTSWAANPTPDIAGADDNASNFAYVCPTVSATNAGKAVAFATCTSGVYGSATSVDNSFTLRFPGNSEVANVSLFSAEKDVSAGAVGATTFTISGTSRVSHGVQIVLAEVVNVAPNTPTAVGRDAGNANTDTTPLLTANITDPDVGQQIKARFEIYQSDGVTLVGTVDSAFRTGDGVVTVEYSTALAVGSYKVRAQTVDDLTLSSAFSALVDFQVTSLVTKDSILKWNVYQSVPKDLVLLWNVQQNNTKDFILLWNVLLPASVNKTFLWDIYPVWTEVPYEAAAPTWEEVTP